MNQCPLAILPTTLLPGHEIVDHLMASGVLEIAYDIRTRLTVLDGIKSNRYPGPNDGRNGS